MARMLNCRRPWERTKLCPAFRRLRRALVIAMYRGGVRTDDIAAAAGYGDRITVTHVARKAGVKLRGRGYKRAVEAVDPATGEVVKRYAPIKECRKDGYRPQGVSAMADTHKTYKGLLWRHV